MDKSLDYIEESIDELEVILHDLYQPVIDITEFQRNLSLYFIKARSVILSIRNLTRFDEFLPWYEVHKLTLNEIKLSKFTTSIKDSDLLDRNFTIKDGVFFTENTGFEVPIPSEYNVLIHPVIDVANECKKTFLILLEAILDCYLILGANIDPQQYYTKEYFDKLNKTIDHAECEIHGWVCTSLIEEGLNIDERWQELRVYVGESKINHLFYSYLKRSTPQPVIPEYILETEFTPEDRGWIRTIAGTLVN